MLPPELLWGMILLVICHLVFGFLALWFAQEIGGRLGRIAGRNKSEALAGAILWTLLLGAAFFLLRTYATGIDRVGPAAWALAVLVFVLLSSPFFCAMALLLFHATKALGEPVKKLRELRELRDPVLGAAQKLTMRGDVDGAIAMLRGRIEADRPTAERLNWLGLYYSIKGDHAKALDLYHDAKELGGPRPTILVNQAETLRRLGRHEESIDVLDPVPRKGLVGLIVCYSHCVALADLGRTVEAREQLREAERLGRSLRRSSFRKYGANLLRECRQRLDRSSDAADAEGLPGR